MRCYFCMGLIIIGASPRCSCPKGPIFVIWALKMRTASTISYNSVDMLHPMT